MVILAAVLKLLHVCLKDSTQRGLPLMGFECKNHAQLWVQGGWAENAVSD